MTESNPQTAEVTTANPSTDRASPADSTVMLNDISVRLGDVTALDQVSASVGAGQFLGLIGPNGAGKTTLLRTITGVVTPDSGSVRINGHHVDELSSKEVSRNVAVVPQDTSLAFDFNVREIIGMGRTPYIGRFAGSQRSDREAVERAMKRTEIEQFADRSISEVSGGERQRILLARAIAQDTPVLLLDEPTASLDINHQVRTLELVKQLVEDGKTVIAAIHDLDLAARYCDELLLLREGEVRARGFPGNVLSEGNIQNAFDTQAVILPNPVTNSLHVTALTESCESRPTGQIHVICGNDNGGQILLDLWRNDFEVSVGPLPEGHSTLNMAKALGVDAITITPFEPISPTIVEHIEQKIQDADATVITDVDLVLEHLPGLDGETMGSPLVVVEDQPTTERTELEKIEERAVESIARTAKSVSRPELIPTIVQSLESDTDEDR